MNAKLQKLGTVAALLVMAATGQAGADPRHDDTKPLVAVAFSAPRAYAAEALQSAAPARSAKDLARSDELSATGKTLLPEPGNWSMVLAGLLGVVAIARRRMSA